MADVAGLRCVDELRARLQSTKENVRHLDETIKKISSWTGGGRGEGGGRGVGDAFGDQRRAFPPARRPSGVFEPPRNRIGAGLGMGLGLGLEPRRGMGPRGGDAFSRLGARAGGRARDPDSEDEAEEGMFRKQTVQSSIIVTPKEEKSRQDIIAQQSRDSEGRARNRRMFGLLMGTLVQFKQDEQTKVDQEMKRKAVELKLEEKAREEKAREQADRRQLFESLRDKKRELRHLEDKMALADIHAEWETQTRALASFIRTDARPHLFYLPKVHVAATLDKLARTSTALDGIIAERRKLLEQDIAELTNQGAGDDEAANENEENEVGPLGRRSHKDTRIVMGTGPGGRGAEGAAGRKQGVEGSDLEEEMDLGVDYGEQEQGASVDHGGQGDTEGANNTEGQATTRDKEGSEAKENRSSVDGGGGVDAHARKKRRTDSTHAEQRRSETEGVKRQKHGDEHRGKHGGEHRDKHGDEHRSKHGNEHRGKHHDDHRGKQDDSKRDKHGEDHRGKLTARTNKLDTDDRSDRHTDNHRNRHGSDHKDKRGDSQKDKRDDDHRDKQGANHRDKREDRSQGGDRLSRRTGSLQSGEKRGGGEGQERGSGAGRARKDSDVGDLRREQRARKADQEDSSDSSSSSSESSPEPDGKQPLKQGSAGHDQLPSVDQGHAAQGPAAHEGEQGAEDSNQTPGVEETGEEPPAGGGGAARLSEEQMDIALESVPLPPDHPPPLPLSTAASVNQGDNDKDV